MRWKQNKCEREVDRRRRECDKERKNERERGRERVKVDGLNVK